MNFRAIRLIGYYYRRFSWIFYIPFAKSDLPSKVVFFIGNQGDGLSFVSRLIRRNKNVVSITGNHKYWTGADEMCTVMEPYLPYELRLPGILTKEISQSELSAPRSWSYGANEFFESYISDAGSYSKEIERKFLRAINTSLRRFGVNKVFVDKSQVYSLKMKLIQKILGKRVYFVHITRNPYVSIFRAANGKAGDLKRYKQLRSIGELEDLAIQHFVNTTSRILNDIPEVDNYLRLKFEDVLLRPEEKTKQICDFLGLEFETDQLPQENQPMPFFTKYRERWFPINPKVNEKYLEKIDSELYNKIDKKAKELIQKLGYQR